jgi:acetate---CoA ligase (ADP-forming)
MSGRRDRPLLSHGQLRRLIHPAGIAIVGASATRTAFGARCLAHLSDYRGRIHLVNPKYREIDGHPCHASVRDLPEPPDCVVVATARDLVEPIVRDCAAIGAGGVIVFASGYAETGTPEHVADQKRLAAIAAETGLRVLGPNCIGIVNYVNAAVTTFAGVPHRTEPLPTHAIGLVSQSGAMAFALSQAQSHGTSFSHILSSGNACDVDVADQIAYLAEDDSCRAIACLLEGMNDPQRLLDAAALAAANGKVVVVHKTARGSLGAAAAMSHTGSLAGSDVAYAAAFERAGIVAVETLEQLIETTVFFAKAPRATGRGVAMVSASGGASIIAADEAERHGVDLPQPQPETVAVLKQHIPDFGSARNPCDVTAQVANSPASLAKCAEALFTDPNFDAVLLGHVYSWDAFTPRIKVFGDLAREHGRLACVVWLTEALEGPGAREAEQDSHVALFRSMSRCFAAIKAWQQHADWISRSQRSAYVELASGTRADVTRVLQEARDSNARMLTEREAKPILRGYGVPVVEELLVHSAEEAAEAADGFGYPVALKVMSPDLPHKTEAGVLRIGLGTRDDVVESYAEVMANARTVASDERIHGVLVQPMVPAGVEVMVGARHDPQFGAVLLVGLGGVFVELMKDTVAAIAPVSRADAKSMLNRLRGGSIFAGFRGGAAVDLDALADVIARLSQFAANHTDTVAEFDVNPLICAGNRIVAVDALIRLQPA